MDDFDTSTCLHILINKMSAEGEKQKRPEFVNGVRVKIPDDYDFNTWGTSAAKQAKTTPTTTRTTSSGPTPSGKSRSSRTGTGCSTASSSSTGATSATTSLSPTTPTQSSSSPGASKTRKCSTTTGRARTGRPLPGRWA